MTQSPEPIDYEAVLSDLEAKRAALDVAIAALRQVRNAGAHTGIGTAGVIRQIDPENIPDDAFFGLSIGEAAKKYLGMVKRKQSTREIAEALDRGGLPHTSSNFLNTVTTMLSRQARSDSDLVKVGREWGLAAWYGNRRPTQARSAQKAPTRKPRGHEVRRRQVASRDPSGPSTTTMAEKVLSDHGGPMTVQELMAGIKRQFGRDVDKATLVSSLSRKVNTEDTFSRPAPSTYGLIAGAGR